MSFALGISSYMVPVDASVCISGTIARRMTKFSPETVDNSPSQVILNSFRPIPDDLVSG